MMTLTIKLAALVTSQVKNQNFLLLTYSPTRVLLYLLFKVLTMTTRYQYWEIELKNQAKQIEQKLTEVISSLGGEVVDRHEDNYFSGRQRWRNPLLLLVKLPQGKRFTFINATNVWLHRPTQVVLPLLKDKPIPLRGNHDCPPKCRSYRLNPSHRAYIKDHQSGKVLEGAELVSAVLDGNLDLILDN